MLIGTSISTSQKTMPDTDRGLTEVKNAPNENWKIHQSRIPYTVIKSEIYKSTYPEGIYVKTIDKIDQMRGGNRKKF